MMDDYYNNMNNTMWGKIIFTVTRWLRARDQNRPAGHLHTYENPHSGAHDCLISDN